MTFKVAIIGRPNVGKSTFFNRLVGKRLALVDDTPGVTRDRRLADAWIGQLKFQVIGYRRSRRCRTRYAGGAHACPDELAIADADVVLFLIDARAGLTPSDRAFAELARRSDKKVILVANKFEGKAGEAGYYESLRIGPRRSCPAIRRTRRRPRRPARCLVEPVGTDRAYPPEPDPDEETGTDDGDGEFPARKMKNRSTATTTPKPLRIAVVGRPNAGKSTLITG